ncbi:hypothetical protein Ddye_023113 [Dipteronia dyeriana]|uniref:non-specific serine/threonine protein kinase n=1 Tax=Dipteronia dyeriana TaxID=168575 RepID=A0AAD9TTB4_9ROSI|nr:hypothetical protein Ddye_023113 [Dipteronia dyeriana]
MLNSLSCSVILLWCFSLLLICCFSTPSTATINTNEIDRLALLAIKSQLHDPLGVTHSWNKSLPMCQWTGVSCGHRHPRVTKLDLSSQSIRGHLSPSIGNLSFLMSIHLENNSFNGEIPLEVGRLFRLKYLILTNNSFSGTIPTNLSHCTNLVRFIAFGNNLVGEIPVEIDNLLKLEKLNIGNNHLTGKLPASIGNLSSLQLIHLGGNSLGGRIPDTLGQLRNLYYLNLALNKLSGRVPPSVYNISSLESFSLLSNRFNGILPLDIGFNLPNLETFIIAQNNFTGPLPDSLVNASNLVILDLSKNHFSGQMSIDFSGLKNLSFVNLAENDLGIGTTNDLEFITSLKNCSELKVLSLYGNGFGGFLPNSISNLSTTITQIAIGSNQISGTIPPGIGNLFNLASITMEFNQLTGTIPSVIGELKDLQLLYLHVNNLQGNIPSSLGNLTLLNKLELGYNSLEGNIPSSLGNCQNLITLLLNSNKFTGTVPQEIVSITTLSLGLDLSDNLLSGPFPPAVSNLKNLLVMDISRNQFSGEIPFTIGSCTSLEYLYMMGNSFNGSIPPSLSSLKSIKELDLSSNNLSGQIPEYLENLTLLKYLNLSYNHFDGEVPTKGVFQNKTEVSLTGNKKLCGGLAEMHLPSCPSKGSKKLKIMLLKVVIPVTVSSLILLSALLVVVTRRRKSANKISRMLQLGEQFPMISYVELSKATNEFSSSNMIGQGRYGSVYKGVLAENGMLVAVKVINLQQKGASKSFTAECDALRHIRHRNLIKIVTICSSIDFKGADFKALVYEYMQNGSLEEWLHQNNDELDTTNTSHVQRLNIAIDVASAIEYLHCHCEPPIVHGDLKPSNVLLDNDMVAHVGDFGLAKLLSDHSLNPAPTTQSSSLGIKGTIGYVAPEYGMGSGVSMPGDVYSFGILLLEMLTGRRPTDSKFNDGLTLHDFARTALPERVMEIVEPSLLLEARVDSNNVENFARLHGEGRVRVEECLVGALRIGVLCSMESPAERMDMTDVVAKLCAVREKYAGSNI